MEFYDFMLIRLGARCSTLNILGEPQKAEMTLYVDPFEAVGLIQDGYPHFVEECERRACEKLFEFLDKEGATRTGPIKVLWTFWDHITERPELWRWELLFP
jgi:hypothetical protein